MRIKSYINIICLYSLKGLILKFIQYISWDIVFKAFNTYVAK